MSLNLYVFISMIIMMILLVIFIINDREVLCASILIEDLSEASIISVGWILTIPILIISKIILTIIYMFED